MEEVKRNEMVEEVLVKNVKVYKCVVPKDYDYDDEVILLLKVYDTNKHGIETETIVSEPEPDFLTYKFSLAALCFSGDDLDSSLLHVLSYDNPFLSEKTCTDFAKELTCYVMSCYDFVPRGVVSMNDDLSLVVDVEVHRRLLVTKDYVEAKSKFGCDDCLDKVTEIAKSWFGVPVDDMEFSLVEVKSKLTIEEIEKEGDQSECAICLTKFSGGKWVAERHAREIVTLGCGHAFHHRCIFDWLRRKPSCPLCRASSLAKVEIC